MGGVLEPTFGAAFIGMSVAAVLHGMVTLQVFNYYISYPNDAIVYKLLVAFVFVLDNLQLGLLIRAMYHYLILEYGNFLQLLLSHWTLDTEILLTSIITFTIRSFFTYRVWVLSKKNIPLVAIAVLFGCGQLGFGIWVADFAFTKKTFASLPKFKFPLGAQTVCGVTCDLLLTGLLCFYLKINRGDGYNKTNRLVNNLIVWTVNTGLIMAVAEATVLVTFFAMPDNFIFLGFHFLISKIYSNCLLASLNSRKHMRGISGFAMESSSGSGVRLENLPSRSSHIRSPVYHIHSKTSQRGNYGFAGPLPTLSEPKPMITTGHSHPGVDVVLHREPMNALPRQRDEEEALPANDLKVPLAPMAI